MDDAERQKLISEANSKVSALVAQAEKAFIAQDFRGAEEKLHEARRISKATQVKKVQELEIRVANSKVQILLRDAVLAMRGGDVDKAKSTIAVAMAVQNATQLSDSQKFHREIEDATNPVRIRAVLVDLSEEAFQALVNGGELPDVLATPYPALNQRVGQLVKGEISAAELERESKRLAKLESERKEQERKDREIASAKMQALASSVQKGLEDAAAKRAADAERNRKLAELRDAERKADEEIDVNDLVVMRKTLEGREDEITGVVVNRRKVKLRYVQITFNLYDETGAQVGSALANVNGLEPGGTWKFKASTFGTDYSKFKFSELSGF